MEYLPQVDSPKHETARQRRRRVLYMMAAGAEVDNMPLFGVDGSGLIGKNKQGRVFQI